MAVLQAEAVFLARDDLKIQWVEMEYEPQEDQSHQERHWGEVARGTPTQSGCGCAYAHASWAVGTSKSLAKASASCSGP